MISKWYAALSLVPVAVILMSPHVLARGADPRGFGPAFIGVLVGLGLCATFVVVGAILVVAYRRSAAQLKFSVTGIAISAVPLVLVLWNQWG